MEWSKGQFFDWLVDWLIDWLIYWLYAPWANKFQYQWQQKWPSVSTCLFALLMLHVSFSIKQQQDPSPWTTKRMSSSKMASHFAIFLEVFTILGSLAFFGVTGSRRWKRQGWMPYRREYFATQKSNFKKSNFKCQFIVNHNNLWYHA